MIKFGLIGNKISYSLSPQIHSVIYARLGADASYSLIDIPQGGIGERMAELKTLGGFNVTQPHKIAITEFLTENRSPIQAVNTVKVSGANLYGYNTDITGFRRDVLKNFGEINGLKTLIVGAGGMAEAAAFTTMDLGSETYIKNRTAEKAEALCKKTGAQPFENGLKPDFIVNCSSAELFGGAVDLCGVDLSELKFAYDAIYKQTEFLLKMRNVGAKVANGFGMLIYQAIAAAEIFLDKKLSESETESLADEIRRQIKL